MAAPIDDPTELAGKTILDQLGNKVGDVQELYAPGGEGDPMWATVELSMSLFKRRIVFVPIARLKAEDDEIHMPYSKQYISAAPEVEPGGELSAEDDQALRDYYGVDRGDLELRTDGDSYAAQVPEGDESAQPL